MIYFRPYVRLSMTRVRRMRLPRSSCNDAKSFDLRASSLEAIGLQMVSNQAEVMQHGGSSRDKDIIRHTSVAEQHAACLSEPVRHDNDDWMQY